MGIKMVKVAYVECPACKKPTPMMFWVTKNRGLVGGGGRSRYYCPFCQKNWYEAGVVDGQTLLKEVTWRKNV